MSVTIPKVGDFGFTQTITMTDESGTAVDISTATTKTFYFKDPAGTVTSKTATFTTNGSDGKLYWTVTTGFLATAGTWRVEAFASAAGWQKRSAEIRFDVGSVIS